MTSTTAPYQRPSGAWCIISGASDGIGAALAAELCKAGFHIVLHGRNPTKLGRVVEDLNSKYPNCQTRLWVADASKPFSTSELKTSIQGIEDKITMLFNNVGGTSSLHQDFIPLGEHSFDEIDAIININLGFMTHLTRYMLPILEKNGPSIVINIGSQAAVGMPYLTVYSGTKGYVESFSLALNFELKAQKSKIKVIGIQVASVNSGGNAAEIDFWTPSSEVFAQSALKKIGSSYTMVTGYWPHAVQSWLLWMVPEFLFHKVMGPVLQALAKKTRKTL